ncbi:hypothetical protein [Dokdonella sp.]|uniref:hypothetical protein n=1 Tax=Dokdonella sp. TaxID=2291710 RepID=UPI001B25E053|nr:hypothetical protein [Dokdonella sp.]MBO9664335.1 hypothetical protein [Dokdonella sp.]
MKRRLPIVPFLFAAVFCAGASAAEIDTGIVIDCAHPALPSQRAVGAAMAQPNPGQAYATRARLMTEARRACRREHAANVRLVREAPLPAQHRLAGSVSYP